jgi:hypothetical protein
LHLFNLPKVIIKGQRFDPSTLFTPIIPFPTMDLAICCRLIRQPLATAQGLTPI